MQMKTLSHIELLIRIHWSPTALDDFPDERKYEIAAFLCDQGLIMASGNGRSYRTTARGACYVEAIRDLPLPVQAWKMP